MAESTPAKRKPGRPRLDLTDEELRIRLAQRRGLGSTPRAPRRDFTDEELQERLERQREQAQVRAAKWRAAHPDDSKAAVRRWVRAHPEQSKQATESWRAANPEKKQEYEIRYTTLHPDRIKAQHFQWKKENPEWFRSRSRRKRALKRGLQVSPYNGFDICIRDKWICQLCGQPVDPATKWPDPMSRSIDHIIPLAKNGPDGPDNVQLAHLVCNMRKQDRHSG